MIGHLPQGAAAPLTGVVADRRLRAFLLVAFGFSWALLVPAARRRVGGLAPAAVDRPDQRPVRLPVRPVPAADHRVGAHHRLRLRRRRRQHPRCHPHPQRQQTTTHRAIPTIRPSWLLLGVASTVAAIVLAARHDLPAVSVLIPAILPDLAFLAAIGQPHAPGQLPSRAVPLYNALHHLAGPGAMLVTTLLTGAPPLWLVVALAWLAHVSIDRGLGYGLRGRDGWPRG